MSPATSNQDDPDRTGSASSTAMTAAATSTGSPHRRSQPISTAGSTRASTGRHAASAVETCTMYSTAAAMTVRVTGWLTLQPSAASQARTNPTLANELPTRRGAATAASTPASVTANGSG